MANTLTLNRLKGFFASAQIQNILSMLGAEVASKLSRIITLIAMAACLVPAQYGTAMLALACHDMIRLILRCGAGAQLVQCSDKDLPAFAQNAVVMQWLLCIALMVLQYLGAILVAGFYDNYKLAELLQQLALVYLFYPLVSVRVFLIQRGNKLKYFGFCNGFCVTLENLSIAAFLYSGTGIEAIVYGKFVYVFLWVSLFLMAPVKTYGASFKWPVIKRLVSNSLRLFQSEFSRSLRINADVFLAGKLLSPEIFGIYSFAKSASIAISQAISNAVVAAMYPQCCKLFREQLFRDCHKHSHDSQTSQTSGLKSLSGQTMANRQIKNITIVLGLMLFAYLCQGLLAPWYIPLFFADTWSHSILPAVILCLAAMPVFLLDVLCCVRRAMGDFASESRVRLGHLLVLLAGLVIVQPLSPLDIAVTILLASAAWLLVSVICSVPAYQTWQEQQQN